MRDLSLDLLANHRPEPGNALPTPFPTSSPLPASGLFPVICSFPNLQLQLNQSAFRIQTHSSNSTNQRWGFRTQLQFSPRLGAHACQTKGSRIPKERNPHEASEWVRDLALGASLLAAQNQGAESTLLRAGKGREGKDAAGLSDRAGLRFFNLAGALGRKNPALVADRLCGDCFPRKSRDSGVDIDFLGRGFSGFWPLDPFSPTLTPTPLDRGFAIFGKVR